MLVYDVGNGAKCPVCHKPLKATLLSAKCPLEVRSYFSNPVTILKQTVKRVKVYRAFQKSQLKGYKKILITQVREIM